MSTGKFVWDKVVRLTHWGVALAVSANLFLLKPGGTAHQVLGYTAIALVVLRLAWAVGGARKPARLRDLLPTPGNALHHLRDLRRGEDSAEPGHNAFGLLAVWAMWGCIALLAFSGYHTAAETDWYYSFSLLGYDLDDWHGIIAKLLMGIVVLHILAVILTGLRIRRNLVRPMIHK